MNVYTDLHISTLYKKIFHWIFPILKYENPALSFELKYKHIYKVFCPAFGGNYSSTFVKYATLSGVMNGNKCCQPSSNSSNV